MAEPHGTIINRAAQSALAPLGLRRKGRSRFWHDDYGWRAFFVEFQPSSWSKGTYCNVGASWLWDSSAGPGHWPFHVSERVATLGGDFVSFDRIPDRFEELVDQMASDAAREILGLRGRFKDLTAVAALYEHEPAIGWPGYHGAVALGLIGRRNEAATRFRSVAMEAAGSDIEWVRSLAASAVSLAELLPDSEAFANAIENQISRTRLGHQLPALEHPLSSHGPIAP